MLEVICSYIIKAIDEKDDERPEWLIEMRKLLQGNSEGLYPSYMHLHLSDYLNKDDRKIYFFEILRLVQQDIQKKGDQIEPTELNAFVVNEKLQGLWSQPLKTSIVLKAIGFLELLIRGELQINVSDPINYW